MINNQKDPKNNPIAFIDSGVGGLPYLKWVKDRLPGEKFIYIADRKNFPYGEKSPDLLKEIVVDLIGSIIKCFSPKIIVIACNTATVIALDILRERYPVPFIGVVPAVKPAAEKTAMKKIGVLGTSRTVENKYTGNLIAEFAGDCEVVSFSGKTLIDFIENRYFQAAIDERKEAVRSIFSLFRAQGIDSLVLGCTHFLFMEKEFDFFAGDSIKIIDSREGVGKQVIRVLKQNGFFSNEGKKEGDLFFHTGGDADISKYAEVAKLFNLQYRGVFRS